MEPIMWDFQVSQTGASLSNFQMEVLGHLHGGRPHVRRTNQWSCRAPGRPRRLTMTSVIAMVSPVIALFLMR